MSSAHSWPEGDAFNAELNNLTRASSSKINAVADMAMSLYKHYKLVVHSLEKYVRRSTRDTRLFGLYVIDALLRRSRAKFGEGPRDIFATRLAINMLLTFAKLIEVRSFDLPRVHKILQSWRAKNIFSPDLQDEMEAIFESAKDGANPDDDDDDEEDERKRQHMEGDASPVPPTGDESPVDFEQPPQAAHVAPAVPAPYAAAPRAAPPGGSRDPRRAAHAAAASSASQSFPPPPAAAPAASASDPTLAALANLQSMLATPAPAAAAPVPAPMAAAAPVAPAALPVAVLPVAPLPPPPAAVAEDDWGYDDEDEEEEDEEARKEKLRVRLEQEKARMEAAQIDLPAAAPAAQTPTSLTTPQDPFGHMQFPPLAAAAAPVQAPTQPPAAGDTGAPAAAPARRSRFGAPKSKEEVEASLAAAAPALLHSSSAASGSSYERRGPTSPPAERRRSRSRSRERDQQRSSYQQSGNNNSGGGGGASSSISISGPNHGGGGGGGGNNARLPRDAQSPGFVRLPDSEQVGTSWVRVLSTTLRVGHAPLSSLGLDPAELRTTLKERFSVFGQVDWLNPTEKQSYVRFRTRRDACMAKSQAHPMQIGGAPARLHWAKAREMDQEMFNQLSGEGAVEAGSAVLQRTPVEAPDLDVDEDFRDKRRGRVGGAGGAGGASEGRGGAAQSSGPESYPVTGWTQPAAAAVPGASPYGTAAQQTQTYPHAMAFLAQQPMQQQQQQQQAYAEQAPAAASGPYVHPSRPWMQQ